MKANLKLNNDEINILISEYEKGTEINKIINILENKISKATLYKYLNKFGDIRKRKSIYEYKHDIIGKTYGYLTVVRVERKDGKSTASPFWAICECKCGNIHEVSAPSIITGRTTSCGCRRDQYKKISGNNSSSYKGYEDISGKYYGTIKKRAERRGYDFNLSLKFLWDLYIKQNKKCALSNIPIIFTNKKMSGTTASLDRIDSNIGYIKTNVQWVHKDVNIMKNIFEQNYFIEMCGLISKTNEG